MNECCLTCDDVDELRLFTAAGAEAVDDANDASDDADVRRSTAAGTVRLLPTLAHSLHTHGTVELSQLRSLVAITYLFFTRATLC